MSFQIADIQKGVVSKLRASSALVALIVGVYDDVPQSAASEKSSDFPFVVVGDDSFTDWDTDTEVGFEGDLQLHIWSRKRGKKEMKDIQQAIFDALNRQAIVVQNCSILDVRFTAMQNFIEPDERTRHGTINFNIKLEI